MPIDRDACFMAGFTKAFSPMEKDAGIKDVLKNIKEKVKGVAGKAKGVAGKAKDVVKKNPGKAGFVAGSASGALLQKILGRNKKEE